MFSSSSFAVSLAPVAFAMLSAFAFAAPSPMRGNTTSAAHVQSTHAVSSLAYSPTATRIELGETIIVARAQKATVARKAWKCGPVELNAVGGSQRTCEYR